MRFITCIIVALALVLAVAGEQQRILRRVIKSTPTASNLARVRLVTVRSASAESGAVSEISSKEAASFGQRSANETNPSPQPSAAGLKTKAVKPSLTTTSTTTSTTTTSAPSSTTASAQPSSTSPAPAATSTVSKQTELKHRASDRQQAEPQSAAEIEVLSSAPSSWQTMTAVEAPAALLIATGTRPASSDLASSSSEESASGDFLRSSSSTKGSYTQQSDTFSRVRQQQQQQQQQQQSFFYPQTSRASKTSKVGTKTNWYQPPATTTTTPRPAPIIQQEQQFEQYVEQQQQVEYGAAPQGQAEPFAFDFKTQDNSGNGQYRKEESDKNGVVRGSYGYTDASGIYRHVEYVADENGFRANIKSNEPGLIGETQPASIQLNGGATPSRLSSQSQASSAPTNDEWTAASSPNHQSSADLALAPPDFESSHKSERLRSPRQFRN